MRRFALPFVLLLAGASPLRAQAPGPRLVLIDTALLASPRLDESSGIVESRRRPGVFWTNNDSGDGPYLYATDSAGADLGRVRIQGARNVDWEDLAMGPCPESPGDCLFIGDIGNNGLDRPRLHVYVVPEPNPPTDPADTLRAAVVEAVIDLRYPDRPHNAEAMAVAGRSLLIIAKDRSGPATLYRGRVAATGSQLLERVGPLAMETNVIRGREATGAAVSGNGKLLAVRTYVSIHLFALDHDNRPLTRPYGLGLPVVEAQGEAICFDHLGRIVLTSEKGIRGHAMLSRLRLEGIVPRP